MAARTDISVPHPTPVPAEQGDRARRGDTVPQPRRHAARRATSSIAIVSADPVVRRRLEDLLRLDRFFSVVSVAAAPIPALAQSQHMPIDAMLVEADELLPGLLEGASHDEPSSAANAHARLTRRELDVLAALADGASNKVIARRLGISFHTAKFHVAAILAKLAADSRTEAVTKAAQLGLIML
jgi:DNA-binding NarL/FixJ family response regulator